MVLSVSDRIFETSSTTGTGTLNLSGAVSGFRSFVSGVGSGKKVPYIIDDGAGGNWEVGVGTVTSGTPDTLSRDYVVSSSNSNALVNWGAGTRNIRLGVTSKAWAVRDENFNFIDGHSQNTAGTANAQTITVDPAPRAYSDGMVVSWFSVGATTGAFTVNVNLLGAKTLKWKGADLVYGDFAYGDLIVAKYKASTGFFELITPPKNSAADGSISYSKIAAAAIASTLEALAGTASKLIDAATLLAFINARRFISAEQTVVAASGGSAAHGFSAVPSELSAYLVCKTTELGYAVGDRLMIPGDVRDAAPGSAQSRGVQVWADSTNVKWRIGADGIIILNASTGASSTFITAANWRLVIVARV